MENRDTLNRVMADFSGNTQGPGHGYPQADPYREK